MDIIVETDKGSGHPILHSVPTGHGERHSLFEQRVPVAKNGRQFKGFCPA